LNGFSKDAKPREILDGVLTWLRKYPEVSKGQYWILYGFDKFINMCELSLPVDNSTMHGDEFEHFRRVILKYKNTDESKICMILRDGIEKLIMLEVERECLNCGCGNAKLFKRTTDLKIVCVCNQCGWVTDKNNCKTDGSSVTFPTKNDLMHAELLSLSRPLS
jgi:hypothetical protein